MTKTSTSKAILINGFGRSGTTYLYIQLAKNFENSLYEPLNPEIGAHIRASLKNKPNIEVHPYLSEDTQKLLFYNYYKFFGDKIFKIIKNYHPNKDGITHHVYNIDILWRYLKHFLGFHIKDGSLHLYLSEEFITDNWEVYHIIRHPIDNFTSILNSFYPKVKSSGLYYLQRRFGFIRYFINKLGINGYYFVAKELCYTYGVRKPTVEINRMSMEEAFLVSWIISNYYAVKALPKERIIVYEKPDTFKRLPFKLKDELKPEVFHKEGDKMLYTFEKIAKKWELNDEYNYLLKFFD